MDITEAMISIRAEYEAASLKFGAFTSAHEGLAIIQEEFEELKAEVFAPFEDRDIFQLQEEAKQVAAMALRFIVDLT